MKESEKEHEWQERREYDAMWQEKLDKAKDTISRLRKGTRNLKLQVEEQKQTIQSLKAKLSRAYLDII